MATYLHPGIYRREDGEIFRVRLTRSRTRVYTQRWSRKGNGYEFSYEIDALDSLTAADLLPLDKAREISRQCGQCLACAKLLSDPKSLAAGIGPSCARNWTYADAERAVKQSVKAEMVNAKQTVRARVFGERILIRSLYNDAVVGIIKSFAGYHWDGRTQEWSLPREHAMKLAEAFVLARIAHDDLSAIGMG